MTTIYPRSWYPIIIANRLKKNASVAVRAFTRDWLVFRDADGKPGMIERYCCHMGADLANGRIVGDSVECALHGWRFNAKGQCTCIPVINNKCEADRLTRSISSLPCQEIYGVIFAYWGEQVEFDIPLPRGMPTVIWGGCHVVDLETVHHAACLNTFDLQHYVKIHHRHLTSDPIIDKQHPFHLGIDMHTRVIPVNWVDRVMQWLVNGDSNVVIDCWGASILTMHNNNTGYGSVIGILPVDDMQSKTFLIPVKKSNSYISRKAGLREILSLMITGWLVRGFLHPDKHVLSGMKPKRGELLAGVDDVAEQYWDYFQSLPQYVMQAPLRKRGDES